MEELQTDDEILRESGMAAGETIASKFNLRPVTALSLSWLQRNGVFDESWGDTLQKTAAFAFLHVEEKPKIRSVVNDRSQFLEAVDEWMDNNLSHHDELQPVSECMERSLEEYMAASTTAAHPNDTGTGDGMGN